MRQSAEGRRLPPILTFGSRLFLTKHLPKLLLCLIRDELSYGFLRIVLELDRWDLVEVWDEFSLPTPRINFIKETAPNLSAIARGVDQAANVLDADEEETAIS